MAVALALGVGVGAGAAQAFQVTPLTPAQQKIAREEIGDKLPRGAKIVGIRYGFGANGYQEASVTVKQGKQTKTLEFWVAPGIVPTSVNVWPK